MLTISENAAEVIKLVLIGGDETTETSEASGLRIAPAGDGLQASVATEPQADDQVVEGPGVRVFLEAQVAEVLGDKTLDAERDDNGELALAIRD
ncbi:HesB/YadR/YfhF-family protein [Saccharopolyspora cebuensis]|uniref:HesB/YadR/YfhF-family protein n=1 Tax=Saccharopolyspora cebuensis TaxID=418759 RepID=A0ABV4CCU9_9PSEU